MTAAIERKLWYLKRTAVFSGMQESTLMELAASSEMIACQKGHRFYWPEEPSERIYLIKEGQIRLIRGDENGREVILDILGPGEIFGELAIAGEVERSHSAEAIGDVLVCEFNRDRFDQFLQSQPQLAFSILKLIGFRFRRLESRLEDLICRPLNERLVLTLSQLATDHGQPSDSGIRLQLTQKDLAYLVGASREAVAEELGNLKRAGFLATGYRALTLLQPDRLA